MPSYHRLLRPISRSINQSAFQPCASRFHASINHSIRSIHSTSHETQPPTSIHPIKQSSSVGQSNQSNNQSNSQSNNQSSSQQTRSQSNNQSGNPRRPPHYQSNESESREARNMRTLKYAVAVALLTLGASYAAVPLYRIFCQRTGYGGTTQRDKKYDSLGKDVSDREIIVMFTADVAPNLHWSFTPAQTRLKVKVGEPVLAFYQATNHREKAVTGVATYNVTPMKTGFYFTKIQCFCFDEQRLRAGETVDMPVFFYIDPAINEDRRCDDVHDITLSYTFFAIDDDEEEEQAEEPAQVSAQSSPALPELAVKS